MTARAFAPHELAARAWYYLSPFPDERALAARRFRDLAHVTDTAGDVMASSCTHVAHAEHVLQVIGELAVDGLHAKAISAPVIRDRLRHIPNEELALAVHAILAHFTAGMHRLPTTFAQAADDAERRARAERRAKGNPR